MKIQLVLLIILPLVFPRLVVSADTAKIHDAHNDNLIATDLNAQTCAANGVVASWCDSSIMNVACSLHPTLDMYSCQCPDNWSACPDECIPPSVTSVEEAQDPIPATKIDHGVLCKGIPQDEPNYVLKGGSKSPPLHHCENNGVVANWCNEATVQDVDCLLLTALDEYVCTCRSNAAACPSECVGGMTPDRKTKYAVRCRGIPVDTPNYILE